MPEIKQLQTCMAPKIRSPPKETVEMQLYEEDGSGLCVPSRNTGRGVYSYGKPKSDKLVSKGKPISTQLRKEPGARYENA